MTTQIGVESGADMRALQIQEQITDDERFLLVLGVFAQLEGMPEDFVGAVEDAGLAELAYRGPVTGRWPTLREMIDSNPGVAILAESLAGRRAVVPPCLRVDHRGDPVRVRQTRFHRRGDLLRAVDALNGVR